MRLTTIFLVFNLLQVSATIYSQSFTIDKKTKSIKEIINLIESQSNYKFLYRDSDIEDNIVTISAQNPTFDELLRTITSNSDNSFKILENNLVVIMPNSIKQQKLVRGTVTDAQTGDPLPGVNIIVEGTTIGVITDLDGNYSIETPETDITLVFSYVGYLTERITLAAESITNVKLVPDIASLEEVVVIGYGSLKRRDLTGSVSSINVSDAASGAQTSVNELLQGRAAGVHVSMADASPGGGVNIRIRGTSTFLSATEPLYIIDGIPVNSSSSDQAVAGGLAMRAEGNNVTKRNYQNPLSMINQNDIESIDILKDASATAIYGARGANGVVIITTKRGSEGTGKVNFDYSFGIQKIAKKLPRLTGPEYAERVNLGRINNGQQIKYDGSTWYYPLPEDAPTTNWQDEIYRSAPTHDYNLSFSGGNSDTKYLLSLNYFNQEGIIINSDFNRYSARFNLDQNVRDFFRIGSSINISHSINNQVPSGATMGPNVVTHALNESPAIDPEWWLEDKKRWYTDPEYPFAITNPLKLIQHTQDETKTNRILGNTYMEFDLHKSLKFRTTAGIDHTAGERLSYIDRTIYISETNYPGGRAQINQTRINLLMGNSYFTWDKTLNNVHKLNAVAGAEVQQRLRDTRSLVGINFETDELRTNDIGTGAEPEIITSYKDKWTTVGFFTRLNYVYDDKYYATFNFRRDGSSRFGTEHKWGNFPSFALAWRLSEEEFLQDNTFLSNLKLRASWGKTGNGDIPVYSSIGAWRLSGNRYSYSDILVSGADKLRLDNTSLKWETTEQVNVGLDLSAFSSRINFTFDYYRKNTKDLILDVVVPITTGFEASRQNVGVLRNQGFETLLSGVLIQKSDLFWEISLNASVFRSTPIDLGADDYLEIAGYSRYGGTVLREGRPSGLIYGLIIDGTFEDENDAINSAYHGSGLNTPGYYKWKDMDGDGIITGHDEVPIGNSQPDIVYGINSRFTYKNFDLTIFFQGVYGNEIAMLYSGDDPYEVISQTWTEASPYNKKYAIHKNGIKGSRDFQLSNYNVHSGSYFRLKNIKLGYSLPIDNVKWIKGARIFASGSNLLTFTKYPGYNPDVSSGGSDAFSEGWDNGAYPLGKVYTFGINLTF